MKFPPFFGSPICAVQARGSMAVLLQRWLEGRATTLAGPLIRRSPTTSGRSPIVPRPCLSSPPSPSWRISCNWSNGTAAVAAATRAVGFFAFASHERSIPEPVMLQDYGFQCRKILVACGGHCVCYNSDGASGFEPQRAESPSDGGSTSSGSLSSSSWYAVGA